MSIPMPHAIPPAAPREPEPSGLSHEVSHLDIIIKLLEEILKFTGYYIRECLPYLVRDGLEFLVSDFQQMVSTIDKKTKIIQDLLGSPSISKSDVKQELESRGLTGQSLESKDRSVRAHMNAFYKVGDEIAKGAHWLERQFTTTTLSLL
jgi:hypothetical protein